MLPYNATPEDVRVATIRATLPEHLRLIVSQGSHRYILAVSREVPHRGLVPGYLYTSDLDVVERWVAEERGLVPGYLEERATRPITPQEG